MKIQFLNNINKDILNTVASGDIKEITDNYVKCSKSVVPNALYQVSEGNDVYFCLGSMGEPSTMITHCWIEVDGKVIQTRVPYPHIKLFRKASVKLPAYNVEKAKTYITDLINKIS